MSIPTNIQVTGYKTLKKITRFSLSRSKIYITIFFIDIKRSKSSQVKIHMMAQSPLSYIQSLLKSVQRLRRRFLKGFTIFGYGGHVTWTIYTNFGSPFLMMFHTKFCFDFRSGFKGESHCQNSGRTMNHWYTIPSAQVS